MFKDKLQRRKKLGKEINNLKNFRMVEKNKEKGIKLNNRIKRLEFEYAVLNASIKYGGNENEKKGV